LMLMNLKSGFAMLEGRNGPGMSIISLLKKQREAFLSSCHQKSNVKKSVHIRVLIEKLHLNLYSKATAMGKEQECRMMDMSR